MTEDNGMEADSNALPIGWERTIYHLQQRIRLLEAALTMAHQIIFDEFEDHLSRDTCAQIQRLLNENTNLPRSS